MSTEKHRTRKKRTFSCAWCDGVDEMMQGCLTDDAGFSECLARMKNMQDEFCGRNKSDVYSEKRWK